MALRSAGYNHVDLEAAAELGLPIVRVPEYAPCAVAEHAVGLLLALNRKIHRAYSRLREWNFSLDGLVGFDLHGKTVGVIGTGRIGRAAAHIFHGFGCRILAHDVRPEPTLAAQRGVLPRPVDRGPARRCAARLLTFPNVLVTSQQALLTKEALASIASTTLANITAFQRGESLVNEMRISDATIKL